MKPRLNLLQLKRVSIYQQLQIEEALLRVDRGNWCLLNQGSPPAIVMGISGKPEEHINDTHFHRTPLPTIRRFTGGGTVVIDENTLFLTIIASQDAINIPRFPCHILKWNGTLIQSALNHKDFGIIENDYVIGEKKFGGNAQYIAKNRWLHHSTLLWDYCDQRMQILKLPTKTPLYRKGRNHNNFLCRLAHFYKDKEEIVKGFVKSLSKHFEINKMNLSSISSFLKTSHRKTTQMVWIKKKIC